MFYQNNLIFRHILNKLLFPRNPLSLYKFQKYATLPLQNPYLNCHYCAAYNLKLTTNNCLSETLWISRRFKHNEKKEKKINSKNDLDSDEESDKEEQWGDEVDDKTSKVVTVRVGSLRIDLLLKAAFGMARNKVETIFYQSKIRINGEKLLKKSIQVNVGDEIDIIRGPSPLNSNFLIVSRVEVLSASENENSISVKLRRSKTLTIENYTDSWKVSQDE